MVPFSRNTRVFLKNGYPYIQKPALIYVLTGKTVFSEITEIPCFHSLHGKGFRGLAVFIPTLFRGLPRFRRPQPCCFFSVLNPEQECSMAGLRIREYDKIMVKTDRDGGNSDDMNIEDFESRLDIDIFREMLFDVRPALLERGITEQNLVVHLLYAAHGVTSSSAFFRGRGLWTAFAAIVVQGNSICFTRSS